jgi:TPR repeat protein
VTPAMNRGLKVRYTRGRYSMEVPLHMRTATLAHRMALWLTLIALAGCQTAAPRPDYDTLYKAADDGEPVSVEELRDAFLAAPDFDQRMQQLAPLEQQALGMMVDEPLRLGAVGSAILNLYYGSLAGHYALVRFYQHVEAPDSVTQHQLWVDKITKSIETAGDGSKDRPYPVMSASEAQAFLRIRGLTSVGSMYHSGDKIPFMMLVSARPEQGPLQSIYFDLTAAYRAVESTIAQEEQAEGTTPTDKPFSAGMLIGFLARSDDSAAQAAIGAYLLGQNRFRESADWLSAASRTGNLLANLMLARVYQLEARDLEGDARKEAMEFVLEQYLHAIAVGSDEAMFALAGLYLDGDYGEDNVESGLVLLKQSAALKNPNALMWLGHLYSEGTHVPKDEALAVDYFKQAAATGDTRARLQYVRFLLAQDNTHEFDPQARAWLVEEAKAREPEAMLLLGNLYAKGIGVSQSYRQALTWFKSAVSTSPDDVNIVNEVAWTLAVTHLEPLRKPSYALEIMDRAMSGDETARKNPAYLDTWAAAYAANGNFTRAVAVQQQAVDAAREQEETEVVEVLQAHLDAFQRGETVIDPVP